MVEAAEADDGGNKAVREAAGGGADGDRGEDAVAAAGEEAEAFFGFSCGGGFGKDAGAGGDYRVGGDYERLVALGGG